MLPVVFGKDLGIYRMYEENSVLIVKDASTGISHKVPLEDRPVRLGGQLVPIEELTIEHNHSASKAVIKGPVGVHKVLIIALGKFCDMKMAPEMLALMHSSSTATANAAAPMLLLLAQNELE